MKAQIASTSQSNSEQREQCQESSTHLISRYTTEAQKQRRYNIRTKTDNGVKLRTRETNTHITQKTYQ